MYQPCKYILVTCSTDYKRGPTGTKGAVSGKSEVGEGGCSKTLWTSVTSG